MMVKAKVLCFVANIGCWCGQHWYLLPCD